jgi:hypothetical protein
MRRTLKLLLLLGIGLALAGKKNGDGVTPGNGDNTIDPTTGKPKTDEQRKKDSTYKDTNAQEDFDGVLKAGDQESQAGRAQDTDGDGNPDIPQNTTPSPPSDSVKIDPKQLNKKFKHADDFGVEGNNNHANREKFQEAIENHVDSPGTQKIEGTYRGDPVIHYVDPATGRNVMTDRNGNFLSAWKLSAGQLQNVTERGSL